MASKISITIKVKILDSWVKDNFKTLTSYVIAEINNRLFLLEKELK